MLDDIKPPVRPQRRLPRRIEPLHTEPKTPLQQLVDKEVPAETELPESATVHEPTVYAEAGEAPASSRWDFIKPPYSRQQKIISSAIAVVLFFGIGAGWTLTHHRRTVVADTNHPKITHKVAVPIYSSLSGLPIADKNINKRPVTAVMIENSVDARPQSGLSQAGVVYEAVAEGGVTRYMALYQDQVPANVGPIRSARPYYVQWAMGYDAGYAHVGGSPDALSDITAWNVRDLNQFYNGNSYHRVSSRAAPHNVYTGIDTLNQLEVSKGYTGSNYTGFTRKAEQPYKAPAMASNATAKPSAPADSRQSATSIGFSLSGYTYDPHYDYDAASNSYKRSEAGAPQVDANTGAQLSPKAVVAIAVPLSQGALDSSGAYYSNYNVIGSGQAWVFQDGTVIPATWAKSSNTAPLALTTSDGKTLPLNRGQTWVSAVTDASKVTYK